MQVMNTKPVLANSTIAALLLFVAPWLAKYGLDSNGIQTAVGLLGAVASAVVAAWRFYVTHTKVTPVANPRNDAGQPLVPATAAAPPAAPAAP